MPQKPIYVELNIIFSECDIVHWPHQEVPARNYLNDPYAEATTFGFPNQIWSGDFGCN